MMKCDMCYDRTSVGRKPMCATVCPSGALFFGTREQLAAAAAALGPGQPLPVRRPDDHHQGPRCWRRATADRNTSMCVSAMSEESSGKTIALDMMLGAMHTGEDEA